jgi:hypothetical protein
MTLLLVAASVYLLPVRAEQAPREDAPLSLDRVVVSAANAGPHVWEYRSGNNRVLVLGAVFPEPRNLDFVPNTIKMAIGSSGVVLGPPGVVVGEDIGIFSALTLWPSVSKTKYLPGGGRLIDLLPPQTLQRWNVLKATYLPKDRDVERMLPMYAGWKLYEALLDREGIDGKSSILAMVKRVARTYRIDVLDAKFHLKITDPKSAVREFAIDPQADLACLESTMSGSRRYPTSLVRSLKRGQVATSKQ